MDGVVYSLQLYLLTITGGSDTENILNTEHEALPFSRSR
jgi:hypothetical protein